MLRMDSKTGKLLCARTMRRLEATDTVHRWGFMSKEETASHSLYTLYTYTYTLYYTDAQHHDPEASWRLEIPYHAHS